MALFGKQLTLSHSGPDSRSAPRAESVDAKGEAGGKQVRKAADFNLDNILKLIPGDVVAIYLAGKGASVPPLMDIPWNSVLFALCLGVCVFLRMVATKPVGVAGFSSVNWSVVLVTSVAFFIWAHAVDTPGPVFAGFNSTAAGFVAMLYGLVAPRLVNAEA